MKSLIAILGLLTSLYFPVQAMMAQAPAFLERYHLSTLRQIDPSDDGEAAQHFDVLLTDGLLAFIHDLAVGRLDAHEADPDWFIPQAEFDAVAFLQLALLSPHLKIRLNSLIPTSREYIKLTEALARY